MKIIKSIGFFELFSTNTLESIILFPANVLVLVQLFPDSTWVLYHFKNHNHFGSVPQLFYIKTSFLSKSISLVKHKNRPYLFK